MLTEPNVNKSQLKEILEKEYDFSIDEIAFNPKGYASWSYIIQTNKGKFFLKLYKPENFDQKVFDFTADLYSKCHIENIVHPIKTKNNEIYFSFDNFKLVLFNFIDGQTSKEQPLNNNQLEELGELFANIHKSHEIIGPYEVREKFEFPFKEGILKIYENIDSLNNLNEIKQQARQVYIKYKENFLNELSQLERLAEKLKSENIEFVNCHGEPSPDNIIVSTEGKTYLIDWDFPIFAPKEKDLAFFDDRYDPILAGYRKQFPNAEINKEVRKYYGLLWNVQEIEDWGKRLLLESQSEEENKNNYAELLNFLNYSGLKYET